MTNTVFCLLQAMRMLIVVFIVFVLCWSPQEILVLYDVYYPRAAARVSPTFCFCYPSHRHHQFAVFLRIDVTYHHRHRHHRPASVILVNLCRIFLIDPTVFRSPEASALLPCIWRTSTVPLTLSCTLGWVKTFVKVSVISYTVGCGRRDASYQVLKLPQNVICRKVNCNLKSCYFISCCPCFFLFCSVQQRIL